MAALLLLAYAAVCVLIFKVLRVPVNKWTVTTAGIAGIIVVGGLLAGMNYNHPFTTDARIYFYTTPIVPTVKGEVIEVNAKPNVPLRQGQSLFRIDPKPYQYIVDQKRAALAEAEQNVKQLGASLQQAAASAQKAQSQFDLAQENFGRQQELLDKKVIAQATLDTATRNLDAARQSLLGAQAAQERAELAVTSQIDGVNTTVARLQADLRNAEYDLAQTNVAAPTDGYVAQMLLRPGMTVSPSTPTMVFIHGDDVVFAAAFSQAATQRVQVGSPAEAAFDAVPGRVFAGRIATFGNAIAQGQLQVGGTLINPEDRSKSEGSILFRIDLIDDVKGYSLPAGAKAQVAVYSDYWRPVAVIRKILLRMKSWLNYVI
jgi:multidrug resistance efflux pump